MRNVSVKICGENQNTFYVQLFFSENHVVYVVMLKNMIQPNRPQMEIRSTRALYSGILRLQTHIQDM